MKRRMGAEASRISELSDDQILSLIETRELRSGTLLETARRTVPGGYGTCVKDFAQLTQFRPNVESEAACLDLIEP
ncbi:MAG: hypothetical protein AAAB19_05230 [Rhizobium sp.]|jgi:hypothetical protein